MKGYAHSDHEQLAAKAFNKQSSVFDELYAENIIIDYKRKRVRDHLLQWLTPDSLILELNAGTGDDAVFFALMGHHVHATDIADDMLKKLQKKVQQKKLENNISFEKCSYTSLDTLEKKGPYDCIFSNFGGLNCTNELDKVLYAFDALLKPDGVVTLVIMPGFCLWETLLFLRGDFKTAFRRLLHKNGTPAQIDGEHFLCWYYSPSYIKHVLKNNFEVLKIEGLCTIVPPSYLENFPKKFPRIYERLCRKEQQYKSRVPWRNIGDYFIISLRKK